MKNKIFAVILFLLGTILLFPREDPWGNLKKIYFYDAISNERQVLEHLQRINFDGLIRSEQKEIASQLVRFGDYYFEKKKYDQAEAFYKRVLEVPSNEYFWTVYAKLEQIQRAQGSFFINLNNLFNQFFLSLQNFQVSFILVNHLFNLLFFAGLFTLFLFSMVMFLKYFKLAGNDLVIGEGGKISLKKMILIPLILLWPVILLSGWMIYPFLWAGFLWFYLNDNERKAVKYMLIGIAVLTILYSLNLMLEKNLQSDSFKRAKKVYEGHLYEKEVYDTFDNELKVAQAFAYYENGKKEDLDTALDILNTTDDNFISTQKLDLLGNIYYKYGEIAQSVKYYSESLQLDNNNKIALNNFTLALLKENKPEVFQSYIEPYPQIDTLRKIVTDIKDIKLNYGVLWERLFNPMDEKVKPFVVFKGILKELLKFPVFYYLLFFVAYVMGLKRFLPVIGESTYCSKCDKIIKEASIHRSYKLCDECYQLFSIKDVIFLEAKILKEKELKNKFKKKYIFSLIASLVFPGLNFNNRGNNRLFLSLSIIFYFLLGFAVIGSITFNHIFSTAPLFFNLVGIGSLVFYLMINIFSVLGEENGF